MFRGVFMINLQFSPPHPVINEKTIVLLWRGMTMELSFADLLEQRTRKACALDTLDTFLKQV